MAEGKMDPARIALPKTDSEVGSGKGLKGNPSGVLDVEKVMMGFVEEPKDQLASENSIPLSPQWLYSRHSESKVGNSAASGDTRPPNSLPHGTSTDSVQRDSWRLDGPPDRKEWRRNIPDVENSRWRDEERETSLLGRRECRKEGDRESEFRKTERRSENISTRDSGESRNLPSLDRWHEASSRNTGNENRHENRRDSKWSSRWGPEDKDSRAERKMDADKEDQFAEKQSLGSSRLLESDSRDKWRPRHRLELHSAAPTVYRAAPGFALDRGREEVPHVGFALGRGRGGLTQLKPFSAGPSGAAPLSRSDVEHAKSDLVGRMFRYPRGKLLDIYRKQKMLSDFETAPDDLADIPLLTKTKSIAPLAFISLDADEEAHLDDISKGKVTGSEASYSISKDPILKRDTREMDPVLGIHGDTLNNLLSDRNSDGMIHEVPDRGMMEHYPMEPKKQFEEKNVVKDAECLQYHGKRSMIERALPDVPYDVSSKLPNDSSSLFEISFMEEIPRDEGYSYERSEGKHLEITSHEELSLFYLDPQGDIQGPFLGVDIISWFEQGFFGLDLPVCFSDAPEGTPFQPLVEVMAHLKGRSISTAESTDVSVPFDIVNDNFEHNSSLALKFEGSFDSGDQRLTTAVSESMADYEFQPHVLESIGYAEHPCERARFSELEISSGISDSKSQSLHDFAGQDADEVVYSGRRHSNDIEKSLEKPANDCHDISRNSVHHQFVENDIRQALTTNPRNPSCNDMNPLGLLWSELEGSHDRRPISSNIAGIHDQACNVNPFKGLNSLIYGHENEQFNSVTEYPFAQDAWPGASISGSRSNEAQDIMDAGPYLHVEANSNHIGLDDPLLPQQFQRQHLQNHLSSPHQNMHAGTSFTGPVHGSVHHGAGNQSMVDFEYLIKLQLQEQQLQQIHQQQQLQQQQELHHQIQILQHQQQEQQQQRLFEHLLRQQSHDPSFAASHNDQLLRSSSLDQTLMRQRLIQNLESQPHHLQRHQVPILEQLMQSKLSRNLNHEQHDDLLDVLSHRNHSSSLSMKEQIFLSYQQEQLQARQFSLASRQRQGMEEDRHVGGIWSFDESGQFVRTASSPHQAHLNRLSQLDFVQSLQQRSSFEQASQLEQNLMLHERMQHHPYDTGMQHFDNSIPFSHSHPETNPDVLNTSAWLQGFDVPEIHGNMNSLVQARQFHPVNSPHEHGISNQTFAHHLDAMDSHWAESNGLKAQLNQLNFESGRQRRDMRGSLFNRESNLRSANSNYGIDELFQQKLVLHPSQHSNLVDTAALSYEDQDSSWFTNSSLDSSSKIARSSALHSSFTEGSGFGKQLNIQQDGMMNLNRERQASDYDTSGNLALVSSSCFSIDLNQLFPDDSKKQAEDLVGNDSLGERVLSDSRDGKKLKQLGSKGKALSNTDQAVGSLLDHEMKANAPLRHSSMGSNAGGVNFGKYGIDADFVYSEGMTNNRSLGILDRGSDKSLKRTQDTRHTPNLINQGSLGELVSASTIKGKNLSSFLSFEGGGEAGGNNSSLVVPGASASDVLKDTRLPRTSSRDADAPEASFADLIKSTYKPAPESELQPSSHDLSESGHGVKSGKKKGKKGRQIDPSLLGFKVHSNRIMMGEIQRLDD